MNNVKYLYVRDANNFPVGCFAYRVNEVDEFVNTISYAFSVFYMNDNFDKKFGRDLTRGRLENAPQSVGCGDPEAALPKVLLKVAAEGVNHWSKRDKVGHRFLSACKRTAAVLQSALDRSTQREGTKSEHEAA